MLFSNSASCKAFCFALELKAQVFTIDDFGSPTARVPLSTQPDFCYDSRRIPCNPVQLRPRQKQLQEVPRPRKLDSLRCYSVRSNTCSFDAVCLRCAT